MALGKRPRKQTEIGSMAKRPEFRDYRDYLRWRLDRRLETVQARIEKVKRYVDGLPAVEFSGDEADRIWLDQFVKGNGLDICCGDFLLGDENQAFGVDGAEKMVGMDYFFEGDELTFADSGVVDFIVTNYLDGLPDPLKALTEWFRCLREGGTLAVVCRDAESYPIDSMGGMRNHRRVSAYTHVTLSQYLHRVGYKSIKVERTNHNTLRALAIK